LATATTLLILLLLSEAFMLAGDRLYLTAVVCALALVPGAFMCGILGWQRVRLLLRRDSLWSLGSGFILLTMFMLVFGQIYIALLVYAVMLITTSLICIYDWQRVKALAGHGRWLAGAVPGASTLVILALLLGGSLLVK
jgi:hypothetical protein